MANGRMADSPRVKMKGTKKSAKRLKTLRKNKEALSPEGTKKRAKLDETEAIVTETHVPEKRKKKKVKVNVAEVMFNDLLSQYNARMSNDSMVTPMKRKAADVVVAESSKKKQKVKFIMQRNTVLRKL